ncbi:MAG: 30S ribosomal protein S3 [Candidatus Blackburnbacteria bacterium RIFCSPHIGHO2_01_FULL_44_64]|uniref:Small ribosomal subunit protein uS3 n=1 Tax=Candidatus Blackburnbacteria bacterium RIFCSPHIGHO2_02_FULL_44_20 TaxID=1797516 RepID=A0A1G1V8T9_9BACT|nr:MAG: 30S ribosomal protein S3 [Candidatus Blackburnbacteria bacterium RIFCSPHIGHO2_01_FULL_44_64]OGY11817.1 MAG: 30S ribosomal protein S3 [Candidatus Blackburnbacteria bacterium RIFCSPHIGHO2_12_FULL_44_25]OGY11864.1 MAG: 30S ribosomal protein S3 [Candidatus Blackburnbacteria bacterium RIFCSPHIGHO2_02_FULL_44_20]OGY14473.1 MAG: 30S ribosomal protein S3 [Candidatus Blackburnbacteria bacterium RIFCSPLOWO2_01_FULL_44_43]
MGQKVNPISFRTGVFRTWKSRWFATRDDYRKFFFEDIKLRRALEEKFKLAGVHSIEIERLPKAMTIKISVSRPGIVIGRGGSGIEETKNFLRKNLSPITNNTSHPKIDVIVEEVKNPELSARLVSQRIVGELERRMPHRRVVTRTMERVMAAGARGVKISLAGRIDGAEIGRTEKYKDGSVPTQSLRANIDYAEARVLLKRGYVGIKVWIYPPEERKN